MSESTAMRWYVPMTGRSKDEARAATPLELFFDLVFVVAIARAAGGLHHGIAGGHAVEALQSYLLVFFAIWWAWINFTWFASAYDTEDVPYRLAIFVQLVGALVLAAGVPTAFATGDFAIATLGYGIMRASLIAQWLRAGQADVSRRKSCRRYAIGLTLVQTGWFLLLLLPVESRLPILLALIAVELLIPVWAEQASPTIWNREHIAERYGLFTIIVLGESILAASTSIQQAVGEAGALADLAPTILGAVLIVLSMWWLYFGHAAAQLLTSLRVAFVWGYVHYFVFAAIAAVGAGLAVVTDQALHHAEISAQAAGMAVAVPVAIYLLVLWFLHDRPHPDSPGGPFLMPAAAVAVLLTPFTGQSVAVIGIVLACLVTIRMLLLRRTAVGRTAG